MEATRAYNKTKVPHMPIFGLKEKMIHAVLIKILSNSTVFSSFWED